MCGRYSLSAPTSQIIEEFELGEELDSYEEELKPRYNISPTQKIPVIIKSGDTGRRLLRLMKWQFIPSWTKDIKKIPFMINARAESVMTKPSFKGSFFSRRCIIPASAFYEWKKIDGGKQPMLIRKKNNSLMGLAGLWDKLEYPAGDTYYGALIITTEANSIMSPIHDRMPVILDNKSYAKWLEQPPNKEEIDKDLLSSLLVPCPDSLIEFYAIAAAINSPKNDYPDLIKKIEVG
jgi:putative SOS response-associated peptidase YedK